MLRIAGRKQRANHSIRRDISPLKNENILPTPKPVSSKSFARIRCSNRNTAAHGARQPIWASFHANVGLMKLAAYATLLSDFHELFCKLVYVLDNTGFANEVVVCDVPV